MPDHKPSRREFLGTVAVGIAATRAVDPELANAAEAPHDAGAVEGIPYRMLGKTGIKVSMVGLGGFHIGKPKDGMEILDQAIQAAKSFKPMSREQVAALLARTAAAGRTGRYELSKTTNEKDSTARHIEWLG